MAGSLTPPPMPCVMCQVRLTLIARVSDGLPLAEGLDRDEDPEMRQYDYKNQAKVCTRYPHAWPLSIYQSVDRQRHQHQRRLRAPHVVYAAVDRYDLLLYPASCLTTSRTRLVSSCRHLNYRTAEQQNSIRRQASGRAPLLDATVKSNHQLQHGPMPACCLRLSRLLPRSDQHCP